MHGLIHCALEELVLQNYGEEIWSKILNKCCLESDGSSFLTHRIYPDSATFLLFQVTADTVGQNLNKFLESYGSYFFEFCKKCGYDKLLRVLGSSFEEFLRNLDNLHNHLGNTYVGIRPPSFRVTNQPSGDVFLHYYSEREGLYPIAIGLIKTIASKCFEKTIDLEVEDISFNRNCYHVTMKMLNVSKIRGDVVQKSEPFRPASSASAQAVSIDPALLPMSVFSFQYSFPFFVLVNKQMEIIQAGRAIKRLAESYFRQNNKPIFSDIFDIQRPVIDPQFNEILEFCNQVFVLKMKCCDEANSGFRLKGGIVNAAESESILFLLSPRLLGIEDMIKNKIYLSDFGVVDPAKNLFLANDQLQTERELSDKLQETKNRLKVLQQQLCYEKLITDQLIHSILPPKVAYNLCNGLDISADSYEMVSILFTDICGFTALCADLSPLDIIKLLNMIFVQFDSISTQYGVYKVETIGDAYMAVSGIPNYIENHADLSINAGLDMVAATNRIRYVTTKPIQIRVGVHSGPVIAGVVGKTMPRYCLFGNTVTVANKTESLSIPSKVNITQTTKRYIVNKKLFKTEYNPQSDEVLGMKCFFVSGRELENAISYDETYETPVTERHRILIQQASRSGSESDSVYEAKEWTPPPPERGEGCCCGLMRCKQRPRVAVHANNPPPPPTLCYTISTQPTTNNKRYLKPFYTEA